MQHVICYVSTATEQLNPAEIQQLMEQWCNRNGREDIKGILLYSDGHFFQVLEGEKQQVLKLFFKIKEDPRHRGLIQVMGKDVEKGSLDHYIVDNLKANRYEKPELIKDYLESVKGMESHVQQQIKTILESFIDTRVL
jgi:flagellar motor component MotA